MSKKGGAWEREIADLLSDWWVGKPAVNRVFWRTSNSGGTSTVRSRKGKTMVSHAGDLTAVDPIGEPLIKFITLELKRGYSSTSLFDVIDVDKGRKNGWAEPQVEGFIQQAVTAAKNAGTPHWLLMVKRDKRVPAVFFSGKLSDALGGVGNNCWPGAVFYWKLKRDDTAVEVYCTTLSWFLSEVTPKMVKAAYQKWRSKNNG
jgi:hypothetical protein